MHVQNGLREMKNNRSYRLYSTWIFSFMIDVLHKLSILIHYIDQIDMTSRCLLTTINLPLLAKLIRLINL